MAAPGAAIGLTPTVFDNSSAWHNFTLWTLQRFNVTRYTPSLEDLIFAGPRMLTKLGSIISLPDAIDGFGQRVIPDATGSDYFLTTTPPAAVFGSEGMAAAVAGGAEASVAAVAAAAEVFDADPESTAVISRFSMEGARGLGSVFSYATSKWALSCVAMAIILNRTHIFAASRRRLRLTWPIRLFLRFLPILLFSLQAVQLLRSIQCQTSPDFAEMRWGNSSKSSDLMFAQNGGYLHSVSSTLLLGQSDYDSCRAVSMVPPQSLESPKELRGSLSRLWPLFGTLCFSHFVETLSCALQGRPVAVETGMTLFEHSLAFAEADAAISNQLGWGLFSNGSLSNASVQTASGASIAISRSMIMHRVNTPPEVLMVGFLSAMSHLTSHVLGVFGLQSKFRLYSTGLWAMCFMVTIVFEAYRFSLDSPTMMGLFRYPTVCILGFVPHVLVLGGIVVCAIIYGLALVVAALSPSAAERHWPFRARLKQAHENMQANISLSEIRITREMDFYTALLRTGFGVITMASEAVYLNEDRNVSLKARTWLEEERYRELDSLRMQWATSGDGSSRFDSVGTIGLVPVKEGQIGASNGFARERAAQKIPKNRMGDRRPRDGVGASERSNRWLLALEFVMNINKLVLRSGAVVLIKIVSAIGLPTPRWLSWCASIGKPVQKDEPQATSSNRLKQARMTDNQGNSYLINDENADFEAEVQKQLLQSPETATLDREEVDARLYNAWKKGSLWGNTDSSGDWEPAEVDDDWDTTSMIYSVADTDSESIADRDAWIDDDEENNGAADGQRTPTQSSPQFSRESTPFDQPIAMSDLARLLHPQSPEERQEAHALAAHFGSERILTRSQYVKLQQIQRTKILLNSSTARRAADLPPNYVNSKLTAHDEAELLEQLILARRRGGSKQTLPAASTPGAEPQEAEYVQDATGEDGAGGAPVCVVCHSSPRSIIVWPCRCLSLCDECRVTLAMNNFDKCVCCRREVISFSRIYVP
ncbi:Zinc finger C3HC4 type protein [Microdochium nivale]|nr:Zinc finger C3HC4 type protein [Microdochium nivale]